jgi:hypothetical protein
MYALSFREEMLVRKAEMELAKVTFLFHFFLGKEFFFPVNINKLTITRFKNSDHMHLYLCHYIFEYAR